MTNNENQDFQACHFIKIKKQKMTNDKFIMIDLNDEKAGHIAEVLKNKTAKKILDYLGDVKEASEKDIADGLGMAINTIEYNLKKLIKAGFIKKSKNFFWSVKGRKIEVYKLAKRHVVISPGRKPRLDVLKTILPLVFIVAILVAFVGFFMYPEDGEDSLGIDDIKLKQFKSQAELEKFLADNSDQGNFYGDTFRNVGGVDFAMAAEDSVASVTESGSGGTSDFSKTNIQVEGVDEADIVKNDGEFIYVVSGNRVLIVDAHPAEDMKILSEINFTSGWVGEIYINKDKLVVFGNDYYSYVADEEVDASNDIEIGVVDSLCAPGGCGGGGSSKSVVYTYDISDKENPILEDRIENNGNYVNSRMIGDYVYVIYNKYIYLNNPVMPVEGEMEEI